MKFWKVLCETTVFWRHVRRFSALSETSLCVETVSFFAHKLDPRQAILKRACEESQGPFDICFPQLLCGHGMLRGSCLAASCARGTKGFVSRYPERTHRSALRR